MNETIQIVVVAISIVNLVLLVCVMVFVSRVSRRTEDEIRDEFRSSRSEFESQTGEIRRELGSGIRTTNETVNKALTSVGDLQQKNLQGIHDQVDLLTSSTKNALDKMRTTYDEKSEKLRTEMLGDLSTSREKLYDNIHTQSKEQRAHFDSVNGKLKEYQESTRKELETIRNTFNERVKELQENNQKKLEEMRHTVDEKLHETLEKRLGESFKQVSEQLDNVNQGVGEMKALTKGVGDLKSVLSNVKTRGTWAEVQLGSILEQVLAPNQYQKNVMVTEATSKTVEFALKLPGPRNDISKYVWLPIDSKFPQEDYVRLQAASETGDSEEVSVTTKELLSTIRTAAKDISEKYIRPPDTTDFAIMFLATEGLYAEALRDPAFAEELLRDHRIVVSGPSTLAAFLSSIRMGFQTLAIEERASEVWQVLGAAKTEFRKFGGVLSKLKKQLDTASRTVDDTGVRTRAIERKLKDVHELTDEESIEVLDFPKRNKTIGELVSSHPKESKDDSE